MATLDVYLKGKKVGRLVDAPVGLTFAYDAEYADSTRSEPLSHVLPVRAGEYAGNAVESYFSNLLPDDYVRTRIGEILKIPRENTFALLESIGGDCAGAIAFYRPGVTPTTSVDECRQLDDDEAVRILADLEKRPHQEDFCQVLGIDPKHKYEAQGGPGLAECQGLLSALDLSSAERIEFWGRIAFNFLVGNGDAHGKNFSVLYQGGHCTLAPMYDIMSTTVYPEVGKRMAMKVDGEYAFKWVTLGKFVRQAEKLGLRGNFIEGVLQREAHKMLKSVQSLAKRLSRSHPSGIYSEIADGIRRRASQLGVDEKFNLY